MNQEPLPAPEREEPPYVLATLMSTGARAEHMLRWLIGSVSVRVQMLAWAGGAIGSFLLILSLSIVQGPGWEGLFKGLFAGGFFALLYAAGFGWLLLWARAPRASKPVQGGAEADALNQLLAPTLRELNAVRAHIIRQVKARSTTRVPLALAAALVVWIVAQWSDEPPDAVDLVIWLFVGALAGEAWAFGRLQREYERLYKSRVLPALAARVGQLTYKPASAGDVEQLRAARILPECDSVHADDEIAGTHRGLGIRIIEARLRRRSGDDTRTVFDGLLIEIMLPRHLTGTTAVLTDEGVFGNLKTRWRTASMEPVRLEHQEFERRFEVYSDDQIEARALLTPAFMERFTALASSSGFSLPGALAEGNRLVVALPKRMGTGDLFEPPPYWKPAGGQVLVTLERDIRAVLGMADTVVALDFWAAGRR
jgi:hypothetical protein